MKVHRADMKMDMDKDMNIVMDMVMDIDIDMDVDFDTYMDIDMDMDIKRDTDTDIDMDNLNHNLGGWGRIWLLKLLIAITPQRFKSEKF